MIDLLISCLEVFDFFFPIFWFVFIFISFFIGFSSSGGLVAYCDAKPEYVNHESKKKKVVVLGTGWAGTSFLKNMKSNSYDIHVVSPRNYFAFTPLLPSVTCGTVEARSVVEPIRSITRKVLLPFPSIYIWSLLF